MGTDFALACVTCKTYIDLHKWCIVPIDSALEKCFGKGNDCGCPVDCNALSQGVADAKARDPEKTKAIAYIGTLIPLVELFVKDHKGHQLVLYSDLYREPWSYDKPDWFEWRQVRSVSLFHFLPRNLIEEFGLKTWKEVREWVKTAKELGKYDRDNFDDFQDELKKGFEHYCARHKELS
ncbi:hypothetical protein GF342_01270 [Candidatus Woesearchaeota archaeon]|nr:hypothetical protein [Candidatus Woesearchaeota archaeon]